MLDDALKCLQKRLIHWGFPLVLFFVVCPCAMDSIHAEDGINPFDSLVDRLVEDGFDKTTIDEIYQNPNVSFEKKGVSAYFMHNEAKLNYGQFLKGKSISAAKKYMNEHQDALESAQHTYGVDKEVIVAIALVETRLGTYTGNKSVINTLSTLAVMYDEDPREAIWESLPDTDQRISRKQFEKKADKKSSWAYRELKGFLTYTEKEKLDPTAINGSYAGAMGIPQFMPSNIGPHGKDGDADGRVDLFVPADAIYSIAAYLKNYGWKPGISREKAYKVVYHYNHSKYYVNTVLDIAEILKG
jgi:membrane-bound lytic murein transglycosylase B